MDRRDPLAGGEIEDVGAAAEGIHLGLGTDVCPLQAPPALEIEDFGAVLDESMKGDIKITVIATGFERRPETASISERLQQ